MKSDLEIALRIIEALENQTTHTRVTRGYGVEHPHFGGGVPNTLGNRTNLGKSRYEVPEEKEDEEDTEKVKVSRAFK